MTTPQTFVGLAIAPGDCFCASVPITGLGTATPMPGDLVSIGFMSDCCPNFVVPISLTLPDCQPCDPCQNDWVTQTINTGDPCCASLDINLFDDCDLIFKKIVTEIITPGVTYSSANLGAPYTGNWSINGINPQVIEWGPVISPALNSSYPGLINFCLDNPTPTTPQQVDVHYVVCDVNGQDSIACTESFFFQCFTTPPGPCLELKSDSVYCNAAGVYFYDFCVTYNSATCIMTDLNIFALSPYAVNIPSFTGLNILPGDCFCATIGIGSTGSVPMAGDIIHLSWMSNCCPNEPISATITLPECCDTDMVDLSTGLGLPTGTLDPNWSVILDPIASTSEPRPANTIDPYPTWSPPIAGTQWISAIPATTGGPQGEYIFERCFCMDEDFVNPMVQLNVLVDDQVEFCLNGIPFGSANSSTSVTTIGTNDASLFQTGKNCIQAKLVNFDNNLMGINIQGMVTADAGLQYDTCCDAKTIISGHKWNDYTGDGIWQDFEPGIEGWTIQLSNGDIATTDENGFYSFCVDAGTYAVSEVMQTGWYQTYPSTGNHIVTLAAGDVLTNINFGNREECPTVIDITTGTVYNPLGGIMIQAGQTVTTNLPLGTSNNGTMTIQAGDEVLLEPGFEVELGVECTIQIQGCGAGNVIEEEHQF